MCSRPVIVRVGKILSAKQERSVVDAPQARVITGVMGNSLHGAPGQVRAMERPGL